jgi:hypothetical protein
MMTTSTVFTILSYIGPMLYYSITLSFYYAIFLNFAYLEADYKKKVLRLRMVRSARRGDCAAAASLASPMDGSEE